MRAGPVLSCARMMLGALLLGSIAAGCANSLSGGTGGNADDSAIIAPPESGAVGTGGASTTPGTCSHSPCDVGGKLASGCRAGVANVCAVIPGCCLDAWGEDCAAIFKNEFASACSEGGTGSGETTGGGGPEVTDPSTGGAGGSGMSGGTGGASQTGGTGGQESSGGGGSDGPTCAHDLCAIGAKLDISCDPCIATVCETRYECCAESWTAECVEAVVAGCGIACPAAVPECAHAVCETGEALVNPCKATTLGDEQLFACVTTVCSEDAYCCETAWDQTCITEATTLCSANCPTDVP